MNRVLLAIGTAVAGLFFFASWSGAGQTGKSDATRRPVLLPSPSASIAFAPDGQAIALGGVKDGAVTIWNKSGKQLQKIQAHKRGTVFRVAYSADGKILETRVVNIDDEDVPTTFHLWDLSAQKSLFIRSIPWQSAQLARFSPDYRYLAFTDADHSVTVWDIGANKESSRHAWPNHDVVEIEFAPNNALHVTTHAKEGKNRHQGQVWDAKENKEIRQEELRGFRVVAPDGKNVAEIIGFGPCIGGVLFLRDKAGGKPTPLMHHDIGMPSFSPDSKFLSTVLSRRGGSNYPGLVRVKVWDVRTAKALFEISCELDAVAFSPDGKILALGGPMHTLLQPLNNFKSFGGTASVMAASADAKHFALGDSGGKVTVYDRATGNALHNLYGHNDAIQAISFSSDGKMLATGSSDHVVRIWIVDTGKQLHSFNIERSQNYAPEIRMVLFSKDGSKLSVETIAELTSWDLKTGKAIKE